MSSGPACFEVSPGSASAHQVFAGGDEARTVWLVPVSRAGWSSLYELWLGAARSGTGHVDYQMLADHSDGLLCVMDGIAHRPFLVDVDSVSVARQLGFLESIQDPTDTVVSRIRRLRADLTPPDVQVGEAAAWLGTVFRDRLWVSPGPGAAAAGVPVDTPEALFSVSGVPEPVFDSCLPDLGGVGKIWELIEGRLAGLPVEYRVRVAAELQAVGGTVLPDLFLLVREIVVFCREHDILVGPGRGSSAGSLVLYLLGVTSADPVKYGLLFERFFSPYRVGIPDVDVDVQASRRGEVVAFLRDRFGEDNVAGVLTDTGGAHPSAVVVDGVSLVGRARLGVDSCGGLMLAGGLLGAVKVDLLPLATLDLLQELPYGEVPDPGSEAAGPGWDLLAAGNVAGLFQVDSARAVSLLREARPRDVAGLARVLAQVRPGSSGGLLFQEDSMRACRRAGFTPAQVEQVRVAVTSKSLGLLDELEPVFARLGGDPGVWDSLVGAVGYQFCEAHAVAYALLVYRMAWLKAVFPARFGAAWLRHAGGRRRPARLLRSLTRMGVRVVAPVLSERCRMDAYPLGDSLFLGLRGVYGMDPGFAARLVESAPFTSLNDFYRRARPDRGQMRVVARAGLLGALAPRSGEFAADSVEAAAGQAAGLGGVFTVEWGLPDGMGAVCRVNVFTYSAGEGVRVEWIDAAGRVHESVGFGRMVDVFRAVEPGSAGWVQVSGGRLRGWTPYRG